LARSAVPDGLSIIAMDKTFPPMSTLGMELKIREDRTIPAMSVLVDYIKQALF